MKKAGYRLLWAVIFLGILFAFEGINDTINSKKTPVDFNSIKENDLSVGMIVEGDIPYNFGAFEEEYHTTYGIKTGDSDYTYLIPIGETKYMGLKSTTKEQVTTLNIQTDATIDYTLGDSTIEPTPFHFKGRVTALTTEEQNFMKSYLMDMGYLEQETKNLMVNYKIQCVNFNNGLFKSIVGILLILIGGFILISPWIEERKHSKRIQAAHEALTQQTPVHREDPFTPENAFSNSSDNSIEMQNYHNTNYNENENYSYEESQNTSESAPASSTGSGLKLKLKDD